MESNLIFLVCAVCIFLTGGSKATGESFDPCKDHSTIREDHRKTNQQLGRTEPPACDSGIVKGWYRFPNGGVMANSCVQKGQCGAISPIWMLGEHPKPEDGMVTRTACVNTGESGDPCCASHRPLGVKNCGHFFVYYLVAPPTCDMKYCVGDTIFCPRGTTSATGLSPCTKLYPDLKIAPTLSGPIVHSHAFRFACEVNFPQHETDLAFEVQWTFDEKADPNVPDITLNDPERVAYLPGTELEGHLGQSVGCKVRGWYKNAPHIQKSQWKNSNETYYAGIRVGPTTVIVDEKGGNATVKITSTVPLVCNHDYDAACCLHFQLDIDGPKKNVRLPSHPCEHTLCAKDWNPNTNRATTEVVVAATPDGIKDGDRSMYLVFEPLKVFGSGAYLGVFANATLEPVKITAKDSATKMCRATGDPHYSGFYGNKFNLYSTGDFTMYRNERDRFEIQTRNTRCNHRAACNCAIVIREETDVIRINNCHRTGVAPRVNTNNRRLRQGTEVRISRDGKHIMVYLPSGREVKVDVVGYCMNVYLTVPSTDHGAGAGLCGPLGDDPRQRFTHRNGTVQTHGFRHGTLFPVEFTDSWRVNHQDNLLDHLPRDINEKRSEPHYCQCDKDVPTQPRINCSAEADTMRVQRCGSGSCNPVQNLPTFMTEGWSRRRDAGVYLDTDQPDPPLALAENQPTDWNLQFPTPSGITETQAKEKCRSEIQKSQLFGHCKNSAGLLDDTVSDCVMDVLYGDNYDMVEASVAAFTAGCQFDAIQDVSNYVTDHKGDLVLNDVIADVCSQNCLRHGRCVQGKCVCEAGFTGDNCQLVEGQPPQLLAIRGSNLCDINRRPCQKVFLDAEHFQTGDKFHCRVTEKLPSGKSADAGVQTEAQFISGDRVACSLPDAQVKTDRSVKTLSISLTYDGQHYSNGLELTVFDSTCQDCTVSGCSLKPRTCLIDNVCHQDGDLKPDDHSKMCNVTISTARWSDTQKAHAAHPNIGVPTLTGPDQNSAYTCNLHAPSHDPDTRFDVVWVLDGHPILRQVLDGDDKAARFRLGYYARVLNIYKHHNADEQLKCQVRSFHQGQSDFTPYVSSNAKILSRSASP